MSEESVFSSDLWTSNEEVVTETYTDANGIEREERVQSMPPPSLTKAGPSLHSAHVLERHTGTSFLKKTEGGKDSVPNSSPFDDTLDMAYLRPDTAPSSESQKARIKKNMAGTLEAPEMEEGEGRGDVYKGYNLKNPDEWRRRDLPPTARSMEPESSWYTRAMSSIFPSSRVENGRPNPTKKAGEMERGEDLERGKKSSVSFADARKAPVVLGGRTAYDLVPTQGVGRNTSVSKSLQQPRVVHNESRIDYASENRRLTRANGRGVEADIFLDEQRDAKKGREASHHTSVVTAPSLRKTTEVKGEKVLDPVLPRDNERDVKAQKIVPKGILSKWDSYMSRDAIRDKTFGEEGIVEGETWIDPSKDAKEARQLATLQRTDVEQSVYGTISHTRRQEIRDTSDPRRTKTSLIHQVESLSKSSSRLLRDRSTKARAGFEKRGESMSARDAVLQRRLPDESWRKSVDPRSNMSLSKSLRSEPENLTIGETDSFLVPDGAQFRVRQEMERTAPFSVSSRKEKDDSIVGTMSFFPVSHPSESMNGLIFGTASQDVDKKDIRWRRGPLETGRTRENRHFDMPDDGKGGRETPIQVLNTNFASQSSLVPAFNEPSKLKEIVT